MKFVVALIGFTLAGAVYFLYTAPTYGSIGQLQAQIGQYETALSKAAQLDQLRGQLVSRYNSFNPNDISRLELLLPDHVDNIGLILELDSLASKHGMALENVDVSSGPAAGSGSSASGPSAPIGASQKYASLLLKFSAFGTYSDFLSFLHDLESSLRIVDLASLDIRPNAPASGSQKGGRAYQYDITVKTYWLK